MREITLSELSTVLNHVIRDSNIEGYFVNLRFKLMYEYGLRISETTFDRITVIDNADLIISLSKGSGTRLIESSILTNEVAYCLYSYGSKSLSQSYSTMQRSFNRASIPYQLFLQGKALDLHAFRHRVIKLLIHEGKSKSEIKQLMSITTSSFNNYAQSRIFSPSFD